MKERIIGAAMIVVILIGFASYSGTFAWLTQQVEGSSSLTADLTVGKIFTLEGELGSEYAQGEKKLMVPGVNLIVRPIPDATAEEQETMVAGETPIVGGLYEPCALSISSKATIETQLRVKIEYSYIEGNSESESGYWKTNDVVYSNAAGQRLIVNFSNSADWVYVPLDVNNSNSGWWYYNPTRTGNNINEYIIPAAYGETEQDGETVFNSVDLIDSIYYDPEYYGYPNDATYDYSETYAGKEVEVSFTVQAKQARFVEWGTLAQSFANYGS